MQHKKRARILLQFFWEQRMVGLFLVLAILIFALVFSMYDVKLEAILYASMLCLTAGLLFEGVHLISPTYRTAETLAGTAVFLFGIAVASHACRAGFARDGAETGGAIHCRYY